MASVASVSPAPSPPQTATMGKSPPMAPLVTPTSTLRRTSSSRPNSLLARRISSYSNSHSIPRNSRPISTIFPVYQSSLPYALVRDFAYPFSHPNHYGLPVDDPAPTPASDSARSRRLSDPAAHTWEDSRSQWSATPPWISESTPASKDQLKPLAYSGGGPPYSEDEDLQSPVVTTSRHKKHRSDRGRSPGSAGLQRGMVVGSHDNQIEAYYPNDTDELDGPGGEIETYPLAHRRSTRHRDSNFAKPLQRNREELGSEDDLSDEEARYSKDYSFTIASPDEEMHGKAVALFDFESEHENELPLREGQIILVSYRHGQGWLVAEDPRTGESGLVPEEFVRLVRHIEGGLNGLNQVGLDDEALSPSSNDPGSAVSPTPPGEGLGVAFEKHPPVQSTFSTHTKDFTPLPKEEAKKS